MINTFSDEHKVAAGAVDEGAERQMIVQECSKEFFYRAYDDQEVVCKMGDIGEEYFVLLQGEVSIHSPKTIELQLPAALDPLSLLFLGPPQTLLELQLQQLDLRASTSVSQSNVQAPTNAAVEIPLSIGQRTVSLTYSQLVQDADCKALIELCQAYRLWKTRKAASQLKKKQRKVLGLQGLAVAISSLGVNRGRQQS